MREIKKCCKNCIAHTYSWCVYNPQYIMDEEEMTKERECEKFEETLGAIVNASDDEEVYIIVNDKEKFLS